MRLLFQQAMKVARTDVTVLILGESGSGKEVVARLVHQYSNRAAKPLVVVDCGALPDSRPKGIADLGIRNWICSDCGCEHDRDVNAAKNILKKFSSPVGHYRLAVGIPVL